MRIAGSTIQLSSVHEKSEIHTVNERLRIWGGVPSSALPLRAPEGSQNLEAEPASVNASLNAELTRISLERRETAFANDISVKKGKHGRKTSEKEDASSDIAGGDMKLEVMRLIVEKLSGEKVHIFKPQEQSNEETESAPSADTPAETGEPARQVGWGVEYDYEEIHAESERTAFAAFGIVKTADGKEIAFDVSLEMSRERIDITRLSMREGDAKPVDPLVINFNGNAAALTESKIDFDLDADGNKDSISFVRSGSGFLVLDKNKDGVVNDGTELFGPTSGDGFAELAAYDHDRNGWIDEGDNVYQDLSIWTRTDTGENLLRDLKSSNVGAIYLHSTATPFDLKDTQNHTDGAVKSTGIYLSESGGAGTIQQVDLVT